MDNLLVAIDASSERFSEDSNGSMVDYPASLLQRLTRCPASIGMTVRNGSEWVSGMHRNHCPESVGILTYVKFSQRSRAYLLSDVLEWGKKNRIVPDMG